MLGAGAVAVVAASWGILVLCSDDVGPAPVSQPAATMTSSTTLPATGGVVVDPLSVAVVVNAAWRLPPGWVAPDLVEPVVPFNFPEQHPKRLLRAPAARALEALFAAAGADGTPLVAVSGYRSEADQENLFAFYVRERGQNEAARISARPGHSEHQTGLAMDVTGADRRCPAEPCFAGTPAARWLEAHVHEHGFVIRYPLGKEAVTGISHEPWHLRFVGTTLARHLASSGQVLEESTRATH